MTILECRNCGGSVRVLGDGWGVCEHCDAKIVLPKIDDDKRRDFFNRANHYRRLGDYDRAYSAFEHIIADDMQDVEAHWCLTLCRYGVEYVQDPITEEYLPTVSRMSYHSILEDPDYLKAVEYADERGKEMYRRDAEKIAKIQEEYITISRKEKPYDVFICFKAEDENKRRTQANILAQDLYEELTEAGVRTFFSRVTLRNIAGEKYEPYIFAALNSAKVMVFVTSDESHAQARWVRNEWRRFLQMKEQDNGKLLIPVFKGIPYDALPDEIKNCGQCVDANVLGFQVGLKERILERLGKNTPVAAPVKKADARQITVDSLVKRNRQLLEDGSFEEAMQYSNRILDLDPVNAEAFYYRFCGEIKTRTPDELDLDCDFSAYPTFNRALQYAKGDLKAFLEDALEQRKAFVVYAEAESLMNQGAYSQAIALFEKILSFHDSAAKRKICQEKLDQISSYEQTVVEFERDMCASGQGIRQVVKEKYPQQWEEYRAYHLNYDNIRGSWHFTGWLYMIATFLCSVFFLWWGMAELSVSGWLEGMQDLTGSEIATKVIVFAVFGFMLLYVFRAYKLIVSAYESGGFGLVFPCLALFLAAFFVLNWLYDSFITEVAAHYVILGIGLVCAVITVWQFWWCTVSSRENKAYSQLRDYLNRVMNPLYVSEVTRILAKYKNRMDTLELAKRMIAQIDLSFTDEKVCLNGYAVVHRVEKYVILTELYKIFGMEYKED